MNNTARGDAEVARLRLEAAHAEIARLRLTDAEREAVKNAIGVLDCDDGTLLECSDIVAALRGLLDRL